VQNHLNTLETILLVLELAPNNFVVNLSVLTSLITQIVKHLLWTKVFARQLLCVHESLTHREQLMLTHLNGLGEFSLLLIEASVLLLFLTQLGGSLQESLEILRVSSVFEETNLG